MRRMDTRARAARSPPRLFEGSAASGSGERSQMPSPDRWGIRLLLMILVQLDEVPKGHRKLHVLDGIERIEAERVLETRHDQGKAERVETGLEQLQTVGQPHQFPLLLDRDLLELQRDCFSYRHQFGSIYSVGLGDAKRPQASL